MFELMLIIIFFIVVLYLILYKKFQHKLSQRFLTRPIFVLFVLIIGIPSCHITTYWCQLQNFNQSPLKIKTFDNSNSPYHPSVLYFSEGWNGYKYWMVETPYSPKCKPYRDRNECPSIHVSNDGIEWTQPKNLINPIVNFTTEGEQNLDYYSDPHLVYKDGKVECWYRLTERNGNERSRTQVSLRRVISIDGVNWSEEEIISQLNENIATIGLGNTVVSPSIVLENNDYKIWYVDVEDPTSAHRTIAFSSSNDGYIWENKIRCNMLDRDVNPWHIDVQKINNCFYMVVYDYNKLSLWKSDDRINFTYIKDILTPSNVIGSYYYGLYRSCLVKTDNDYLLYVSGENQETTSIGIMKGETPETLKLISVQNKKFTSFLSFLSQFYDIKKEKYSFIIRNLSNKYFN